jgi:integrase
VSVKVKHYRGAWWVFIHHKGTRKSKRFTTEKAARTFAVAMEAALAKADYQLPADVVPETFQTYADAWLPTAGIKASTRRFYRENLARYIYPVLGKVDVSRLKREHTKRLLVALHAKKLAAKTITGIVRTFSTVCSEAVEDGHLVVNPALKPGRLRRLMVDPNAVKASAIDPYTREEAAALVEKARLLLPKWHAFVLTALRTGLRLGELRALEWGDVDWRGRFLQVARNYVEGRTTTPKSGLVRRVDMSTELHMVLRLHRVQQRRTWLQAKQKPKTRPRLVFPSSRWTVLDDANIRTAMRDLAEAAGVRERARPVHVFRHTFCSLLVQQGESLVYVKEQAGHSTIQITADLYARFMPGSNRTAMDRLDKAGQK